MKIVGIMPARNEDWIIGMSARAAMMWLDELVILNHASTDRTPEILMDLAEEFPERLVVLHESDPVWSEMAHRQRLLECARSRIASHIVIIDADEVLTGNLLPDIRRMVQATPIGRILQIPWLCLRGSTQRVHTSGPWADFQDVSMAFVDSPELHWSNASRGGYDFHHRHPDGKVLPPYRPVPGRHAGLMHLQFVSDRRLRAKQALYKITEILRWPGRENDQVRAVDERYNLAVYGSYAERQNLDFTLDIAPTEWWLRYNHLLAHLHPDAEPWQEREVRRLVSEHGAEKFKGLDLFGVV